MPPSRLHAARDLLAQGQFDRARAALTRHLQASPNDVEALDLLRAALSALGQFAPALHHAQRAAQLQPDNPALLAELAGLLTTLGQHAPALTHADRALTLDPLSAPAHHAKTAALLSLGRFALAADAARAAIDAAQLTHDPRARADAAFKLAAASLSLGQADLAAATLSALLADQPESRLIAESLATVLNYDPSATADRVAAAHLNAARLLQLSLHGAPPLPKNPAAPHSPASPPTPTTRAPRFRLGLLSPDLRQHSVAYFIEPLIAHLDRERFELFIYNTAHQAVPADPARRDPVAARLRTYPSTWRDVAPLSPLQLATTIAADRLDALIELSGWTVGHRLDALHLLRDQSPTLCTYLGYPHSTGLPAIRRRFSDSAADPNHLAHLSTETIAHLDPCAWCYRPEPPTPPTPAAPSPAAPTLDSPAPPAPPAPPAELAALISAAATAAHFRSPPIVFGCFNALTKLNTPLLARWATLLDRVPDSLLLIKARELETPDVRAHLLARAASVGLRAPRLLIAPPSPSIPQHLAAYFAVDIALDSFPYHGTTTTCEALLMGTPVLTLVGDRHASRVGLSLLRALGRPEWAADTEAAHLDAAAALADQLRPRSPAQRHADRRDLRAALLASPLCDQPAFARRVESALLSPLSPRSSPPRLIP